MSDKETKGVKKIIKKTISFMKKIIKITISFMKKNKKRLLMITLMYLIPLINIIVLIFNYEDNDFIFISICSVLASTAAASACTIKGIKNEDELKSLSTAQAFALVFSIVSYVMSLVYNIDGKLYVPLWILILLTVLANGISIYMFLVVDKQLEILKNEISKSDKKEAQDLGKQAERTSSSNSSINLKKKGGK